MGLFIVLEGIDGCGKGEQMKRLHNYLFESDKRNRILTTREPTYGRYGMKIREILRTEKDPFAGAEKCLELYTKDREEHLRDVIRPFLKLDDGENKNIILCDRYYHSTYAFQQTQGIPFERIYEFNKDFLKPTVTFILDVKPEMALDRVKKGRNNAEKFEELDFMKKLRKCYLDLSNRLNEEIIIIDGSTSKEEVFENILKVLDSKNLV